MASAGDRKRQERQRLLTVTAGFVVLALVIVLHGTPIAPVLLLAFGWFRVLGRGVTGMQPDPVAVVSALVLVALLALVVHGLGRGAVRQGIVPAWSWRASLLSLAAIGVAFAASVGAVGLWRGVTTAWMSPLPTRHFRFLAASLASEALVPGDRRLVRSIDETGFAWHRLRDGTMLVWTEAVSAGRSVALRQHGEDDLSHPIPPAELPGWLRHEGQPP